MTDNQLKELQQQLFFEFGRKVDIYHFEKIREVVVVEYMQVLSPTTQPLKVYKY